MMENPEVSIDLIIETLSKPKNSSKPWMTAQWISKRLEKDKKITWSPRDIEACLISHIKQNNKQAFRYSRLPSKRSLEVLWGHKKFVGDRALMDIHKLDEALEIPGLIDTDKKVDVFFSHSHRDYDAVIAITNRLLQADIFPWLAETHIQMGEHINNSIIEALSALDHILLFLTSNALQSKWTGKEFQDAKNSGKKIYMIADLDDDTIKNIISAWCHEGKFLRNEFQDEQFLELWSGFFEAAKHDELIFTYPETENLEMIPNANGKVFPLDNLIEKLKK